MSPEQREAISSRSRRPKDLAGVPSDVFFAHLWQSTLEGFFSDPVYGGNRTWSHADDRFPWRLCILLHLVDQHGIKIDRRPMSLAEDVHGHVHIDPGIPARSP